MVGYVNNMAGYMNNMVGYVNNMVGYMNNEICLYYLIYIYKGSIMFTV